MRNLFAALQRLFRRPSQSPQPALPAESIKHIAQMIGATQEVEYSCDQVYQLLDQFAEAVLRGEDVSKLMPLVQQHLEMCPDCQAEFEALLRTLKASPA